jgi:hypothetical protein
VFKHIKALSLADKIEGATVTIIHGVEAVQLRLVAVKLAKIKLEPCIGGLTCMSCTVQCTPDLDEGIAALLSRLDTVVDIEIDCGDFGKQQDLPLADSAEPKQAKRRGRPAKAEKLPADVH